MATGVRLVSGCKKVPHHRVVRGGTVVAAAILKNDNHNARGGWHDHFLVKKDFLGAEES
jgi:hypothetical protein